MMFRNPFFLIFIFFITISAAFAQNVNTNGVFYLDAPQAIDAVSIAGNYRDSSVTVHLWGLERAEGFGPVFRLQMRSALNDFIGTGTTRLECEWRERADGKIFATCEDQSSDDIGIKMIQQGYATVNRRQILGSALQGPYIQAEQTARANNVGIWAGSMETASSGGDDTPRFLINLSLFIFTALMIGFALVALYIMRGLQKVMQAQKESITLLQKERQLRDKERGLVATMLDSELKANKSKVEAYLVVYEETLKALEDMDRDPRYKRTGDIVQKQPALSRSVFDRNTDRLDILGSKLASELIQFYSEVKTNPEYENIDPDMNRDEVISIVRDAVSGGQELNKMLQNLTDDFRNSGLTAG